MHDLVVTVVAVVTVDAVVASVAVVTVDAVVAVVAVVTVIAVVASVAVVTVVAVDAAVAVAALDAVVAVAALDAVVATVAVVTVVAVVAVDAAQADTKTASTLLCLSPSFVTETQNRPRLGPMQFRICAGEKKRPKTKKNIYRLERVKTGKQAKIWPTLQKNLKLKSVK